jgi:large subunit ribosomal protein L9
MKIVLLENVKKLGKKDEIIEVSDGYARNVIIPKKLGLPATAENLNNVRLKNKNEEKKEENLRNIAEKDKETIEKAKFVVSIKAGANGKTFGSITSKEIAEAIKNESNIEIDKKDILLDESIKNVGTYDVKVKLHKDIQATIKVEVKES